MKTKHLVAFATGALALTFAATGVAVAGSYPYDGLGADSPDVRVAADGVFEFKVPATGANPQPWVFGSYSLSTFPDRPICVVGVTLLPGGGSSAATFIEGDALDGCATIEQVGDGYTRITLPEDPLAGTSCTQIDAFSQTIFGTKDSPGPRTPYAAARPPVGEVVCLTPVVPLPETPATAETPTPVTDVPEATPDHPETLAPAVPIELPIVDAPVTSSIAVGRSLAATGSHSAPLAAAAASALAAGVVFVLTTRRRIVRL